MTIAQSQDGYLTFTIPTDANNPEVSLPNISDYVGLLNDELLANSMVNRHGLITNASIQGVFTEVKPNKFGIILAPEFSPLIFRGQNNDYPFMPASQRYELSDGKERIRHSIDWIKKQEFIKLISNTPYYTRAQLFKILDYNYEMDMEAVAKHYNYVSDYLDVSRNMMIAYFFAYTYVDNEKNQLLPIEDFEKYSPTLYIGNIKKLHDNYPKSVSKMGFQTMLRSKAQSTMSIDVSENADGIKDTFIKIELPKNPIVAKNVFAQYEGGNLIFPADYATRCAVQVRSHKTIQEEFIYKYCEETSTDSNWLINEYKKMGLEIINQDWDIPEQARYIINREIDEYIIPFLNSSIIFRGIKRIQK